ncbi:MAG: hypothetical protein ABIG10_01275 [bacterium]
MKTVNLILAILCLVFGTALATLAVIDCISLEFNQYNQYIDILFLISFFLFAIGVFVFISWLNRMRHQWLEGGAINCKKKRYGDKTHDEIFNMGWGNCKKTAYYGKGYAEIRDMCYGDYKREEYKNKSYSQIIKEGYDECREMWYNGESYDDLIEIGKKKGLEKGIFHAVSAILGSQLPSLTELPVGDYVVKKSFPVYAPDNLKIIIKITSIETNKDLGWYEICQKSLPAEYDSFRSLKDEINAINIRGYKKNDGKISKKIFFIIRPKSVDEDEDEGELAVLLIK